MSVAFRLVLLFFFFVISSVYSMGEQGQTFEKFVQSSDIAKLQSIFGEGLKQTDAKSGVFFVCLNGKVLSGRVFNLSNLKDEKVLLEKTYPLGETSIAFTSLLALVLQEKSILSTSADVNKYFSFFRSTSGTLKGVNIKNLLSQNAGVPYLAEKIPHDSSCSEFFDTLAQMNFSLPETSYSPSLASVSIAGYALAYVSESNTKDLKKAYVRALRKHLFTPLKIDSPKFRLFDKWFFPACSLALNANSIARWLECETSLNPLVSNKEAIASRREDEKYQIYSQGWTRIEDFSCKAFSISSVGNFTLICTIGNDSLAVSMFSDSSNLKKSKKLFKDVASEVNNMLKKCSN